MIFVPIFLGTKRARATIVNVARVAVHEDGYFLFQSIILLVSPSNSMPQKVPPW